MKYKIKNDELGYIAAYEFDNLEDAAHEAAIKCRKHSVVAVDDDGTVHEMWHNWETRKWEFPTHQVNQHIKADGSWFYTITKYGENTSQINDEDNDCPFYGDNEVTRENFCICCGNEKVCEEFVSWEEYGMCLER